ncbi:helix-turn-helix domain-containing protein [Liquorilactobacillus satsumensis]|uniref:helix-turn-helix domain-containing protein n=1 Tax=Liquorilactobacillus TaxID=2767888 RepID=UPI001E34EC6D|nr:helix-turn-helix domain-containing protein [Liquorilactobacillus satsumensis]MCC7667472.1 transcriptional regulator [Liquorilactobacillus satsumensis]MCP9357940.1 helix-turn-helix domain-containing protein [Liquorilactobacillus satsumensis]MCP9371632.1 helix-turn-helix domain-containing protein [Liquorilactobacillus satsumensis]
MTMFERIKKISKMRGYSLSQVNDRAGLKNNVIYSWKSKVPSADRLKAVADVLGVSTDYLLGKTDKENYYDLSNTEKKDLAVEAEKLIEGIENGDNLNFYGEPATQEQKDRLLIAIKTAMEMNKQEAKKKFTRKDYRN